MDFHRSTAPTACARTAMFLALTLFGARTATAQTWSFFYAGTTTTFSEVQFTSSTTGYLATSYSLLKTTNGGANWAQVGPTTNTYNSVFFLNNDTGWVAGQSGEIRKTTNGGTSWTDQTNTGGGTIHLREIAFATPLIGYATRGTSNTSGALLRTTDGGASWLVHTTGMDGGGNANIDEIRFSSATDGLASGTKGIYRTTDGGATWNASNTGISAGRVQAIEFITPDIVLAVGDSGRIFKTVNAGAAWTSVATIPGINFTDIDCPTALLCYVSGLGNGTVSGMSGGHVYKTLDGGATWGTSLYLGTSGFFSIAFPIATDGFVFGTGGTIRRTDAVAGVTPGFLRTGNDAVRLQSLHNGWNLTLRLATAEAVTTSLLDLQGRILWSRTLPGRAGDQSIFIPRTQALAGGVRLLNVRAGDLHHSQRIVED